MQCLRPQKEQSGQEELVSKVLLEDQLTHAAGKAPYDGHGTCDGEKVSHTQPEVPPTDVVSMAAALDSIAERVAPPDGAKIAAPQGTEDVKPAHGKADQPSTDCGPVVGVPAQVEDDLAIPSRAGMPAAVGVIQVEAIELLQAASSSAALDNFSAPDGVSEPGDTGSGSTEDETADGASVSSDSTLDCTSTPVAIGHDPFAKSRHALVKDEEGLKFQYGSLAKSLLHEDSRPCTPEGQKRDHLIIEAAVSLISSPSLPRTHSRPYTPLKYSPQEQPPADGQPSAPGKRSQQKRSTNAPRQSHAWVQDRKEAPPDRLTIPSDSSEAGQERPVSPKRPPHDGQHDGGKPPTESRGRRPKQHRRKHRSSEPSQPSIDLAALKAQNTDGHKAQANAAPPQCISHYPLPFVQHAGMPGSGHSIDWVSETSEALHGHAQRQHRAHSVAQLQSDLQHAQAAELHYLGTIARLSARLESSIAKEGTLKQRLHQLEGSFSSQQPGTQAAHSAQEWGRQHWAGQLPPLQAAVSTESLMVDNTAAQQSVQHGSRVQSQIGRQGSRGSQHQSENGRPLETQETRDTSPMCGKEPVVQQEVIDRLEGELQAVKASLAKERAELEELRSAPAPAAPDQASVGSRMAADWDAGLLTGAQEDAKELRSELAKARQRTEQFAAEARSGDQAVRKLRQEAGELKGALTSSQAECNHLRLQMREANLNVKAAAASEQELKAECSSLRLAVDAARQAAAARGAECMRLQQSLHSSRCELAELAAAHRQLERSALAGQPQIDSAGRRSSLISAPESQRGAQPASQPDFSPPTPGHGPAQASFQAGRMSGGPAQMRPTESNGDVSRQAGPGYFTDAYSRSDYREQPVWYSEDTSAPVSTPSYGHQVTALLKPSAAASYPVGRSLQQSSRPPFATSNDAMHNEAGDVGLLEARRGAAARAATVTQAAGRQNRKSESPPYAVAAEDPRHAGQSLPQPVSREASSPYALHEEHRSADSPIKHAQAGVILHAGQESSQASHVPRSLLLGDVRAGRAVGGPVRDEHESTGMSADEERADSADPSSPRHSVSSLRPYANDASLQDFRVHAQLLEDRLMTLNTENQGLHSEYARMPETSAGKTLAERRRRAEVEARLDSNTKEASNIRLQLKRLNAQVG